MSSSSSTIHYVPPQQEHGSQMYSIALSSPPLETNTNYCYNLFAKHFANDGCLVALQDQEVLAFIQAYRPPQQRDTIFVWQIGVRPTARGRGLGTGLLKNSCLRLLQEGVQYLEATIDPANKASITLFTRFADKLGVPLKVVDNFLSSNHLSTATEYHEKEDLYRIGPFTMEHFEKSGWIE